VNHIAQTIENEMKLLTTSQKVYTLRKSYSDEVILESLCDCSSGNRMAITSIINREYCGSDIVIERAEMDYKDIVSELRGEE
jgi:hypothetical protein